MLFWRKWISMMYKKGGTVSFITQYDTSKSVFEIWPFYQHEFIALTFYDCGEYQKNNGVRWLVIQFAIVLMKTSIYAMQGIKSHNITNLNSLSSTKSQDVVFLFSTGDIGDLSGLIYERQG